MLKSFALDLWKNTNPSFSPIFLFFDKSSKVFDSIFGKQHFSTVLTTFLKNNKSALAWNPKGSRNPGPPPPPSQRDPPLQGVSFSIFQASALNCFATRTPGITNGQDPPDGLSPLGSSRQPQPIGPDRRLLCIPSDASASRTFACHPCRTLKRRCRNVSLHLFWLAPCQ